MNGLLSMIGMQTELDYLMGDFAACFGGTPLAIPKGNIPSDKQKCQPKAQHEFTIKGVKIMAASKKDAIKSLIIVKSKAYEQIRIYTRRFGDDKRSTARYCQRCCLPSNII